MLWHEINCQLLTPTFPYHQFLIINSLTIITVNIINDKPISLAPGSSVYKASHHCMSWQNTDKEIMADESNPNAGHMDSATPKNAIINNHQVSTQNLYQLVILLFPLASRPSRQSWLHLPLALYRSVVCVPQPHSTTPSGPSSDPLSITYMYMCTMYMHTYV